MSIAADIRNLYEYSKETQDEDFKDFTNSILCFAKSQENQTNINDEAQFKQLINDNFNEKSAYKEPLLSLLSTLEQQGFIDYEKFHHSFNKIYKDSTKKDALENEKSQLLSELISNANLTQALKDQENLKNLNALKSNSTQTQTLAKESKSKVSLESTHNTQSLNNSTLTQESPLNDSTLNQKDLKVKPSDLIAFINDKERISFPFSKDSTLDNKDFMTAFYADLDTRSNQELEALIAKVRAKNEALRKELEELKAQNKSNLQETLNKELEANAILSQETRDLKADSTLNQINPNQNKAESQKPQDTTSTLTQESQKPIKDSLQENINKLDIANKDLQKSKDNYTKGKWALINKFKITREKAKENEEEQSTSLRKHK
ncbi:hypothetical protein [Helicobacter turcicus]|uniref:Uncharacterized protein n=1 Tax=Helicobacter turcicus TaxID=2867412 RepID=A0ABS7JP90_9HELI|nr:hypothetical protein [Helicobacter turcicus]MBX7491234.1 hypothetical protein [Helicobacter turcicus]MBX7546127.1 hypothetical protein [Helicobacter turcicus]